MAETVRYIGDPPRTAVLVIIGGGIVGAATAFHASRAGLRPVLLERRTALCTLTTPASTGAFRLQFDNREELELVRESLDLLSNFSEVTGQTRYDPRLQRQGYLWCTTDPARAEWQRDLVRKQHDWGQGDVEHLDGDEVRRRFRRRCGYRLWGHGPARRGREAHERRDQRGRDLHRACCYSGRTVLGGGG